MSSVNAVTGNRGSRVPSIVHVLDPIIKRLIGFGMPFGPNVLLTVRGRTSGQPRTFPIAILEHEGHRYVQSPWGEAQWVRNLRATPEAVVSKGRKREEVVATELTPEQAGPILMDALSPYLRSRVTRAVLGRFFDLGTDSTAEDYITEARRHPMFELGPKV
jgi:deazaflavin-dependent oxidoreductase (nitroreductase family)